MEKVQTYISHVQRSASVQNTKKKENKVAREVVMMKQGPGREKA